MSPAADCDTNKMRILTALVMGVALFGVASCADQSEVATPEEQPIAEVEGQRGPDPEVVLQLKYFQGGLARVSLTQYRARGPAVGARASLCEDLCRAGLGGAACGAGCGELVPVGLRAALERDNHTTLALGRPRDHVCPALCTNHLGLPLCGCAPVPGAAAAGAGEGQGEGEGEAAGDVVWADVCTAFCADNYQLTGCPACTAPSHAALTSSRALSTAAGWQAWCSVQCPQGTGGLACNCDRAPFR